MPNTSIEIRFVMVSITVAITLSELAVVLKPLQSRTQIYQVQHMCGAAFEPRQFLSNCVRCLE